MRTVGIIAEYNPFHNGHAYQIEKALELSSADAALCVMSGDFVQRGEPALVSKYIRAHMALLSGASCVVELPALFATASAEYFARGAVNILNGLGTDAICFGSECGDISLLKDCAGILLDETPEFQSALKEGLASGFSFPAARASALASVMKDDSLIEILSLPNNILAIEYLKQMILTGSRMEAYTVKREGASYHEEGLAKAQYPSASAIRSHILKGEALCLSSHIPKEAAKVLEANLSGSVTASDLSLLLSYKLLSLSAASLSAYADVGPELAARIKNMEHQLTDWDSFCQELKTKNYTYTRISRSLLHILLELKADDLLLAKDSEAVYAHILGIRKDHSGLLRNLEASIPVFQKLPDPRSLSPKQAALLSIDLFASNLYEKISCSKSGEPFREEHQKKQIIV